MDLYYHCKCSFKINSNYHTENVLLYVNNFIYIQIGGINGYRKRVRWRPDPDSGRT